METGDLWGDLEKIRVTLDTSNFPKNHRLYQSEFTSILFKFKSEVGAHLILAGVFLKSKLYTIVLEPNSDQYKQEELDGGAQRKRVKDGLCETKVTK